MAHAVDFYPVFQSSKTLTESSTRQTRLFNKAMLFAADFNMKSSSSGGLSLGSDITRPLLAILMKFLRSKQNRERTLEAVSTDRKASKLFFPIEIRVRLPSIFAEVTKESQRWSRAVETTSRPR